MDAKKFIERSIKEIKEQIGEKKAIIAISGGVDSTTASVLASRAVGKNLMGVFVDTGLMRKNEPEQVMKMLKEAGINATCARAVDSFLEALKGVEEPEEKRKIIGRIFIEIFDEIAQKEGADFLVQGTIGPDWIESGGMGRDKIKSHHNVAGLPSGMKLKLCEPLRDLYKHEVRMVAKELGLLPKMFERQPFPGPGLGVRVVGEVTREKVNIVREACAIVEEEIEKASSEGKMEKPWQYFASLFPTKTVGVRGDERAYQYTIVVRAVRSLDGMTANFSIIPPEILSKISTRITNEIRDVGRVVYDITNKPPGTIEME